MAMISLLDPNTGLGPLCTSPSSAGPDNAPEACQNRYRINLESCNTVIA
jgi:hypothetical protein